MTQSVKIAVVGTGIAGMSAAWLLSQNPAVDLHVFESRDRLGGHSHTVTTREGVAVDTGFIVYNDWTYPNLIALFDHLDVPVKPSDMSFGLSVTRPNGKNLEYAGDNLNTLFAQRKNLVDLGYWRMLADLVRFYRHAPKWLAENDDSAMTLGDYLHQYRFSTQFIHDHLLPMGAAIWSTPDQDMLSFPAVNFIQFCQNHGLLKLSGRPQWRTVDGGSIEYIKRLTKPYADRIRLGCGVESVDTANPDKPTLTYCDKNNAQHTEEFDFIVFASHGNQTQKMLDSAATPARDYLKAFGYSQNKTYLHTDTRQMPDNRRVWSSWNYLADRVSSDQNTSVSVTYWMNRLQNLQTAEPLLVTLNPMTQIEPDKIIREQTYEHPIFTPNAMTAQKNIGTVQGIDNLWFCGSYLGYGFHEDALTSALAVTEALNTVIDGDMRPIRPWAGDTSFTGDSSPAGKNALRGYQHFRS